MNLCHFMPKIIHLQPLILFNIGKICCQFKNIFLIEIIISDLAKYGKIKTALLGRSERVPTFMVYTINPPFADNDRHLSDQKSRKVRISRGSSDYFVTKIRQNRPKLFIYANFGLVWFGSGN